MHGLVICSLCVVVLFLVFCIRGTLVDSLFLVLFLEKKRVGRSGKKYKIKIKSFLDRQSAAFLRSVGLQNQTI